MLKTDICSEASVSSRKGLALVALEAAATTDPSISFWLSCQIKPSLLHAVGPVVLLNIVFNPCVFLRVWPVKRKYASLDKLCL